MPPFAEEIRVLLRCLETGATHPLAAPSARATLEVLLAIYESARRRAVVPLPLAISENPVYRPPGVAIRDDQRRAGGPSVPQGSD